MEFSGNSHPQSQNFASYKQSVCTFMKMGLRIKVRKFLNALKLSHHIKKKCHSDIYKVMESYSHLLQLPFNTSSLSRAKRRKIGGLQCEL